MKCCFNVLIFILNLRTQAYFMWLYYLLCFDNLFGTHKLEVQKVRSTCDSMIGPPCEAYKPSDLSNFTIFVVKFCM